MISNNSVVKSPTSVAVVPTFELEPLVLIRTCNRSGKDGASTVRVKNVADTPFCRVTGGVSSQLLMVLVPVVLLKFAPM